MSAAQALDRTVIQSLWRQRAALGTTRWTGDEMLHFDRSLLRSLRRDDASILDLGSGFGELSRSVCGARGRVLAVDGQPEMGRDFANDPRFGFVHSDVLELAINETFDLVLLFGVVTHLDEEQERALYPRLAAWSSPGGVAVVKNQCADAESFIVDVFSEKLGCRYVGRYPSRAEQEAALSEHFREVEAVPYPASLKEHSNSTHVAFICRSPRGT